MMPDAMRYFAYLTLLAIGACSAWPADQKERAERCVSDQVISGTKISAAKARQAIGKCQHAITEWVDASMRHACRGACDYSDIRYAEERRDRRMVMEERLMMSVSDEVRSRSPRM